MGIAERKEREKQEMRDLIVDAAAEVFAEEGYDKTSIRSIAERIEYSPATIYLYFKDKNEILFAIQEVGFSLLLEAMRSVQTIENSMDRLRGIGQTYIRFSIEHPQHYNLMFVLMAPMEVLEEKKPWHTGGQAFAFLQNTVEECMEHGLMKKGNSKIVAFHSWAFMHGLATLHNSCRMRVMELTPEEEQQVVFDAVDTWINLAKATDL